MDKNAVFQKVDLEFESETSQVFTRDKARILIVDDDAVSRKKLGMAIRNLGHIPEFSADGEKGFERLIEGGIDLVLLDIEMPVMDGFEVLNRMKADKSLRDLPTLVISGLDDIAETAKAIELGAVDFLPKNFDAVILRARVNASLERVRINAREKRVILQIEQLTKAAEVLDSDDLNPMELEARKIATQPGAIGNLSRVLLNKSTIVYNRRQAQTQQIRNLNGILMLLFLGACFGLKPALARLYLAEANNPLAVGFYTMGLSTVFMVFFAGTQKLRWPKISWETGRFFVVLALLTLLPQVLLFWVAATVPGVLIAILISLESFMVFFIAATIGLESINRRRFFGLLLGILGVIALMLPFLDMTGGDLTMVWVLLTMLIPACFAGESILLSLSKSIEADLVAVTTIIFGLSTIILLAVTAMFASFIPLHFPPGKFELTIVAFSLADTVAMITFVKLIDYAGPVFSSQKAYTVATGGVIWSVLLLNEVVSPTSSVALALILLGLYFVAKKPVAQDLLKRTFAT